MADLPISLERRALGAAQEELLRRLRAGGGPPHRTTIPAYDGDGPVPLTAAQQQVWAVSRLAPDVPVFNDFIVAELSSQNSVAEMAAFIDQLVATQDALRITVELVDGVAYQRVNPPYAGALRTVEATRAPGESERDAAGRIAAALAAEPFDLFVGPLFRPIVILGEEQRYLVLCAHHLICDAASLRLIGVHYAAGQPPPPIRFLDYAVWQHRRDIAGPTAADIAYWRDTLTGFAGRVDLPADYMRPAVPTFRGGNRRSECDSDTMDAVRALARAESTTPFVVLLSALCEVLHRVTGQSDLVVGTTVLGRQHEELQTLLGMFADMIPLRVRRRSGLTLRELVAEARDAVVGCFSHQQVPFASLVDALALRGGPGDAPLFSVMLNMPAVGDASDTLLATDYSPSGSQLDLIVSAFGRDGGLQIDWQFAEIFRPETIDRLAGWWHTLLAAAARHPDQLLTEISLADPVAQMRLALTATGRRQTPDHRTIHQMIADTAARQPSAIAVDDGTTAIDYATLMFDGRALAQRLRRAGAGADDRVAAAVRGADLVTVLLATSTVGATLVPLDPAHPAARTALVLATAQPQVIITGAGITVPATADTPAVLTVGGSDAAGSRAVSASLVGSDDLLADEEAEWAGGDPDRIALLIHTSGSTGTPKGVELTHRALVGHAGAAVSTYELNEGDRVLQFASPCFDTAYEQILSALAAGATVVSPPAEDLITDVRGRLAALRVTVANLPTALVHELADDGREWPAGTVLRRLMPGGEALLPGPAGRLLRSLPPDCVLENLYGPTEAVVTATSHIVTQTGDDQSTVPIGTPMPGRRIHLLDEHGDQVLPGSHGELCIGGVLLARGYAGDPGRTAERFVPDPFGPAGSRLYRTGDRARWTIDGSLGYAGRTDRQVKIRGVRVEPEEVENVLGALPGVSAAAVVARPGPGQTAQLDAYVVAVQGQLLDPAELRTAAAGRLPSAAVPTRVTLLPALPYGPTGKVDRAALPEPAGLGAIAEPAEPVDLVAVCTAVMARVLGRTQVGPDEDFFAAGGDSLAAIRLTNLLNDAAGRPALALRDVFAGPTARQMATRVRGRDQVLAPPPRIPRPPGSRVPATRLQHRLWLLEQISAERPLYTIPSVSHIRMPLDFDRLTAAWRTVTEHHAVLRTALEFTDGRLWQRVDEATPDPVLVSGGTDPSVDDIAFVTAAVAAAVAEPFDFGAGTPIRIRVVDLAADGFVLAVVAHHAICDGDSLRLVVDELMDAYRTGVDRRTPTAPDFADWAEAEAERTAESWESAVAAHRALLAGVDPVLDLPADRPRPAVARFRGAALAVALDAGLVATVEERATQLGVTFFTILLAAYEVVLARWTGQTDFVVGVATRNRDLPGTERMVGPLADVLPIRARVGIGDDSDHLVTAARAGLFGALTAGPVAIDLLVEALGVRRDPGRNPLFQTVVSYQETGPTAVGDDVEPLVVPVGAARFDLSLNLLRRGPEVIGGFEFDADLFEPATVAEFGAQFLDAVAELARDPLTQTASSGRRVWPEGRPVHELSIGPAVPTNLPTVPELVARHAAGHPDAVAVEWVDGHLTYADLVDTAARLADELTGVGIQPGDVVAFALRRGPSVPVVMLAILSVGAACLAIDPELPAARIALLLAQGAPALTLIDAGSDVTIPDDAAVLAIAEPAPGPAATRTALPQRAHADGDAHIVFTSGSTGVPKGAVLTHRSIAGLVRWFQDETPLPRGGGVLHRASVAFDVAVAEIWWALGTGHRLVVAPPGAERDPAVLEECFRRHRPSAVIFVPSVLAQYLSRPASHIAEDVRWVVVGGEVLPPDVAAAVSRLFPNATVISQYGLAETTVVATSEPLVDPDGSTYPPAGRVVAGARLYVLDALGWPLPPGGLGEFFVGGSVLADRYFGQPAATAVRFVPDPYGSPGSRMYRTGDLGRFILGGSVRVSGRLDDQVKVGGVRIELSEVESGLAVCNGVTDAAATVQRRPDGHPMLAGYVCGDTPLDLPAIRHELRGRVPAAFVPAVLLQLPTIPRTPGGKIARRELPALRASSAPAPSEDGRDDLERVILLVWREMLPVERIGRTDDFFELGGDSLTAARVVTRVQRLLRVEVAVRTVLIASTVARLAQEIIAAEPRPGWARQAAEAVWPVLSGPHRTGKEA